MIKKYIITLTILLILSSCGKSKEELELEKAKIELEKTKLELLEKEKETDNNKISSKNIELQKIHDQKVNVGKRKKITELNLLLGKLPDAIKAAEQNINHISSFQIGRSASTKEKQLKEAYAKLDEINSFSENLKNEIAQLEYLKTFNFQKTPEGVLHYLFKSTKEDDFSNFRYLCDPYAENDVDLNTICYAELYGNRIKDELKMQFGNGRIIGKGVFKSEKATFEIATGIGSDQLKKITLVNRNGLWYFLSY